jgi:copper chaperone
MATFTVPDMVCSGCEKAITASVHRRDPAARVTTDLATHRVEIASALPAAELADAIDAAGFTPQAA